MEKQQKFSVMGFSFFALRMNRMMDLFGYLETVKHRFGLDTADIWNGFIEDYGDGFAALVKQNLDERGLEVVNLCCDAAHLWDDDEAVRSANEQRAREYLHFAEKIGAKTIRFDVGVRDEKFSNEKLDYVVRKYTEYCKIAESFGARLGPENHWGCSRDPESLKKLFDAVDAKNFGLLLHLGGWHTGDKDQNDLDFIKYAMHTHIDFEHATQDSGHLLKLKEAGYCGCWSAECHLAANEYASVSTQLSNLRRILSPTDYDGRWKVAPPAVVAGNTQDTI